MSVRRASTGATGRAGVGARLDLKASNPLGMVAVMAMDRYSRRSLPPGLRELVCLRASVLNRCHYCIALHSQALRRRDETAERLEAARGALPSPAFTARENAALALTDAVTRLGDGGVSDEVWDDARRHFSERDLGRLVLTIATINVWNRIAITTRPPRR